MKILAAAMVALAVTACSKNDDVQSPAGAGKVVNATITLNDNATRALTSGTQDGTPQENAVKVLEFYVFNSSGNADPAVANTAGGTADAGYYKIASYQQTTTLRVTSGTMTFVVLANMDMGPVATYAALQAKLATGAFKATAGQTDHNSRTIPSTGLEMAGEAEETITDGMTNNRVYLSIGRLVSRIEAPTFTINSSTGRVPIDLPVEDLEFLWPLEGVLNENLIFTYEGYAFANGLDKSTAMLVVNTAKNDTDPATVPWDLWVRTGKTNLVSAFDASGNYTNNYSGKVGTEWFIPSTDVNPLYVYENKPVSDGKGNLDNESVYCFIIKGTLSVEGKNASFNRERYWRVGLTYDDNYHILRNCVYKVNITLIKTAGETTPEKAENPGGTTPEKGSTAVDVVIDILKWRVNSYTDQM